MAVNYEVNITVKREIAPAYESWLLGHVERMLQLPGFTAAQAFRVSDPTPAAGQIEFCIQYALKDQSALDNYFATHAPRMRSEADALFAGQYSARRRSMQPAFALTSEPMFSNVGPTCEEANMAEINWSKIKGELNKFTDLNHLKSEVHRLSKEISKFDIQAHLSPTAKARLKKVESRYQEISKTLGKTQRQVDREVNKVIRQIKEQRARAEKGLDVLKTAAKGQRNRLEKAKDMIKSRVAQATGAKKARKGKKKSTKTTAE